MTDVSLHPALDAGISSRSGDFSGGTLVCRCIDRPVKVNIGGDVLHNHACGCTKCWKPQGAVFSIVGVVPREAVDVRANSDKLFVVDASATIRRHACSSCGVHLYGRIETPHAFHGLDFIHAELFEESGASEPTFAAFVSSVIEGGVDPADMSGIRARLQQLGLEIYDCLNPPLMDALATYAAARNA